MTFIGTVDFVGGTDLPGELTDLPVWEEAETADCPLCLRECEPEAVGLCHACLSRIPRVGGCGLALAVATALIMDGTAAQAAVAHLTACADCRDALDPAAAAVQVAYLEADMTTPHAATPASTAA